MNIRRLIIAILSFMAAFSCTKQADPVEPEQPVEPEESEFSIQVMDPRGTVLDSITFECAASAFTIIVKSDSAWTAETEGDWFAMSAKSGNGQSIVQINVHENTKPLQRTAEVLFRNAGDSCIVNLVQNPVTGLEVSRTCRDLMLFYCGAPGYRDLYSEDKYLDYLITDDATDPKWLFDGALMLEIYTSTSRTRSFMGDGYSDFSTKKEDLALIDNWCTVQLKRLDAAMERAVAKVDSKHGYRKIKVVMMIPILPYLKGTDSWGEIEELGTINWKKWESVLEVYKWEVDQIIEKYKAQTYKHIELAGMYWPLENAGLSKYNISDIGDYVRAWGLKFYFIPYYSDSFRYSIYAQWTSFGWDYCYLQPNYAFYDVPKSRLTQSCKYAREYNMDLEMEFDVSSYKTISSGYTEEDGVRRMRDYLDVFEEEGVFDNNNIAYYQGGWEYYKLRHSERSDYYELYARLRDYVTKRQEEYYK